MKALDNIKAALEADRPWGHLRTIGVMKSELRELLAHVESLERERNEARRTKRMAHEMGTQVVAERDAMQAKVESLEKDAGRWRTALAMPWVLTADSQNYHWGISIARVPGSEAAGDPEVIIDAAMEQTK